MQNEKIIIFDWGGVIESHRDEEYNFLTAKKLIIERLTNHDAPNDSIQLWDSCTISNGHLISETSDINEIKFWFNSIKNKFNFNCTFEEFCATYKEEFMKVYYYKDVVEYIHSLKNRCKIGILSNLGYLDKERIDMQVNLSKFDHVWLSFDLECRKPNEIIYEKVENDLKYDRCNILFIDDTLENIETAKRIGWNTCLACGYELDKIKSSVEKFLKNNGLE